MEMTFINFWQEIVRNPMLFITVLLTLGVIFVNGWTDAPNAYGRRFRKTTGRNRPGGTNRPSG